MAIIGPADLPVVLKVKSDPLKKYVLTMLGHPITEVEITEDMFETALRTTGDMISHYLSKVAQLAYFYTTPLENSYPLPEDAYWVQDIKWDPVTTNISDVFSAESYLFNIGNVTGIQNILTDLVLLQSYRRFSQRVLGTEGHWEVLGDNRIRLYPTPKGSFPVLVLYIPTISSFRSPMNRKLAMDALLAECMIMLGNARSKFGSIPSPDGGSITLNGSDLIQRGTEMRDKIIEQANLVSSDPLPVLRF